MVTITNIDKTAHKEDERLAEKESDSIFGSKYEIRFCDGALESFKESLTHVTQAVGVKLAARIYSLLNILSDGEFVANKTHVKEGMLPDKTYFYAIKKIPIRCYYWRSKSNTDVIFVSHFICKDQEKLNKKDTKRVTANWRNYE